MRKNIRLLYAITVFLHLIPVYVIERLFSQQRGLTVQMVVYTEMVYALVVTLLEMPSGLWADRYGYKRMIVFGCLLACMEFGLLLFARSFWHFAGVAVIAALGGACMSGVQNSLLYQSLAAEGKLDRLETHLGRMRAMDFLSVSLAALIGSLLARVTAPQYEANYVLSLLACVIALLAAFFLRDARGERQAEKPPTIRYILKSTFKFFRTRPAMLLLLTQATCIAACFTYVDEFWQLYLDGMGFPIALFGAASIVLSLLGAPGALAASFFVKRLGAGGSMLLLSGIAGLGMLGAAIVPSAWGFGGIALSAFAAGALEPLVAGRLHRHADDDARATIESFASALEKILTAAIGLAFGALATGMGLRAGFGVLAGVCWVGCVIFAAGVRRFGEV